METRTLYSAHPEGKRTLVSDPEADRHILVSSVPEAFDHGDSETMLFSADAEGEVLNWADLDCWVPANHDAAVEAAKRHLADPDLPRQGTPRAGLLGILVDLFEEEAH